MDKVKKLESLQKLEQIKQHLTELEKQVITATIPNLKSFIIFLLILVRKRQASCKSGR